MADDQPYTASLVGQFRAVGWNDDWELKIHELSADTGLPICGQNPTSYTRSGKVYEMRLSKFLFPKEVTCEACQRIHWLKSPTG